MSVEWYRNPTWNEAIERAFDEKLRCARKKAQYLHIQAATLARSHPAVALSLLGRYLDLPGEIDQAGAHVTRAEALLALGRAEEAIAEYEAALACEQAFPNVLTQAYLDLLYLIATNRIRERYEQALGLLGTYGARLTWPVEHFRWHAASALIAADRREHSTAKAEAEHALEWATRRHSGFRYHASLGLVTEQYDGVVRELKTYANA
jgi:tetratricopeptide (TPR) repeat protein